MTVWSATDLGTGISGGGTTTVTSTQAGDTAGRATKSFSAGKIYFEFTDNQANNCFVGWANSSAVLTNILGSGVDDNSVGVRGSNGILMRGTNDNNGTFPAGNRIAIAFDISGFKLWWKDITAAGAWEPSGDPGLGTGGFTSASNAEFTAVHFPGPYFPAYAFSVNGGTNTASFSTASFSGAIPTGFSAVDPAPLRRSSNIDGLGASGPFFSDPLS